MGLVKSNDVKVVTKIPEEEGEEDEEDVKEGRDTTIILDE